MSDLVERLHALAREYHQHRPHYEEAADEIDRLRATIDAQSAAIERADRLVLACEQHLRDAKHEITKLRADMREAGILR